MARNRKNTLSKALRHDADSIRATLEKVAQFLSGPVDTAARRDLVYDMLCERYRPSQIIRALTAKDSNGNTVSGVGPAAIKEDIDICRKMGAQMFKQKTTEQRMTEALDSLTRTIKRAQDMGDLSTVIQAEKLLAQLTGLLRTEELAQTQLGVVILPEKMSRDEWLKAVKKT